ncbi:MAG: serine hydrolase [Truepera sp.]|nr:serine hydrolase [Truepera sp.]
MELTAVKRLEQIVFDKMAASGLPGLSLALVAGDQVIYARGFGQRDLEQGLAATPDTLYGIGSVTKSFTALAIMRLAEAGRLSLQDPVDQYLPFPFKPKGETVRLHHLLSHTSGLPALAYGEAVIRYANRIGGRYLPIASPEDILTFMDGAESWEEAAPGQRWFYFNEGYALLGLIIERLSGKSYAEYLRDEILLPLGMTRSCFTRQELANDRDAAVPYVLSEDKPPRVGEYLFRAIRSEGGLFSSVIELARYLQLYFEGGKGIVSPEGLKQMMTPYVASPTQSMPGLWGEAAPGEHNVHYGYGLSSQEFFGQRLVGHGGSVLVSTAHLAFIPERKLGVAILANGSGYPLSQLAQVALALELGQDLASLPFWRLEEAITPLVGRYHSFKETMQAEVARRGDFLQLTFPDSAQPQRVILVPHRLDNHEPSFFTLAGGRRLEVTFRPSEAGVELIYERYKLRRSGPL